ncbi:MAG: hypothetical protein AAGH19_00695 [Pseudomonadota bacterium]
MLTMLRQRRSTLRRATIALAALCLLLRTSVPIGFMPGNLLAGSWAIPCPSAFPAAFFEPAAAGAVGLHDHHHGHHHGHGAAAGNAHSDDDAPSVLGLDKQCPLGEALQTPALLPPTLTFRLSAPGTVQASWPEQSIRPGTTPHPFKARAPPFLS